MPAVRWHLTARHYPQDFAKLGGLHNVFVKPRLASALPVFRLAVTR